MAQGLTRPEVPEPPPLLPEETGEPELSFRAVILGILLAAIFGAANAYLGLKAGMTVSATFPAAVIAIALFRLPFFRGGVLEQNIARTTATVGEALVAAAIFTLPAFVMVDVNGQHLWSTLHYWQSAVILLIGGLLGIFFIILMRRTLTIDAKLPFPESHACYEIVRSGQGGESGAKYVFGAMGMGILIELFKNERGLTLFRAAKEFLLPLPGSSAQLALTTPVASPAIISVGYIIGPRFAAMMFSGGALAWLLLIPFVLIVDPPTLAANQTWSDVAFRIWRYQIRPIAVGTMLVAAFYTLWGLRHSIASALRGAFRSRPPTPGERSGRRERDLPATAILVGAIGLTLPMSFFYYQWSHDLRGVVVVSLLTFFLGFLLSTIGGWLVGLIGSSNQPVSGITLAALIVTGVSLLVMHITGLAGVAISLGIAVVICAAAALSGTLIQELKVGEMLGATPWKMELAQIVGTIVVAFVVISPIIILHESSLATGGIGIGDKSLPAPQAGLMAQVATGLLSGTISWNYVALGVGLAVVLILMGVPSPMVIAVGMYLPLETTFAIFVGGVMRWYLDRRLQKYQLVGLAKEQVENRGILLASGLIAGEAISGVFVAGLVMFLLRLSIARPSQWGFLADSPSLTTFWFHTEHLQVYLQYGNWLALLVVLGIAFLLIGLPLRKRPA